MLCFHVLSNHVPKAYLDMILIDINYLGLYITPTQGRCVCCAGFWTYIALSHTPPSTTGTLPFRRRRLRQLSRLEMLGSLPLRQDKTETLRTFCVRTAIPTECIDAQLEVSTFAFRLPYNSETGCAGACFSVGALAELPSAIGFV